jgi:hypothetical protein
MGLIPLGILSSAGVSNAVFPSFIPDLVARYDASDLSSIALSGSDVTQWNDVSGNARHATQGTSTNRPKSGTRTINGINAIDFDGTNDYLFNNGVAASFSGEDKPFTVFIMQARDVTGNLVPWSLGNTGTAIPYFWQRGDNLQLRDASSNISVLTTTGISAATPLFATFRSSGLNFTGYLNKTLVNTGEAYNRGAITLNRGTIGAFSSIGGVVGTFGEFFNGLIGELIYYNRELSALEVGQVHDYLSAKWGV